jgi:type II secretory pathway component PulF
MSRAAPSTSFLVLASRHGGGKTITLRSARSRPALTELLRKERLKLVRAWALPKWAESGPRPLKLADHAVLNDQLAQLLSRGVPLVEALDVVAQTIHPRSRPKIEKVRDLVASGSNFADACRVGAGFDQVTCAVYRASERTGDLAGAARQLAVTARRTLMVVGRAGTLLVYPIIVLTVSLLIAAGMLVGLVPMLGQTLLDSGLKLPVFTKALVAVGQFMQDHLLWLVLALFLAAGALVALRGTIAALARTLMRRLPAMRQVVMAQESARFFSVMAAMSKSGVPLAEALGTANQAISHPTLRAQMERLRNRLIEGGVFRNLVDDADAFPVATRRLLIAAERAGDLESAFNALASDMTEELDRRSQRLLAVLQPLLIVFMFVIIGSLLAAIVIPLLTLSGNLAGGQGG